MLFRSDQIHRLSLRFKDSKIEKKVWLQCVFVGQTVVVRWLHSVVHTSVSLVFAMDRVIAVV